MGRSPIVPAGTQVVTRVDIGEARLRRTRGAVAVIEASPADPALPYAVRFGDGLQALLHRTEFSIRTDHQADGLTPSADRFVELEPFVILRTVVGSRAFGLADEGSDIDRRGIYLAPASLGWSLAGIPEQIERASSQEAYWELRKAIMLGLKANPNVLETLWSPLVETVVAPADELIAERRRLLSSLVYQTYSGYVLSQFKRLRSDLRTTGGVRWKHVMHLLRLLLAGIGVLRTGELVLDAGPARERLLAVRRGELDWSEIDAWRRALHAELDEAYSTTPLPERPDVAWADAFLVRARRGSVDA